MGKHGGFDLDGMSSLTKCIVSSLPYMENGSLGGLKRTDALGGGGGGGQNSHVWLTWYVPLCMV